MRNHSTTTTARQTLPKAPTGITGFDEIAAGGLPVGRPSLICGAAGSGKTLWALTFLVNGAVRYGEPGVFMSFEERADDLAANVASLGFDLDGLIADGRIAVDHVRVERSEIEETGEYDLDGLFVRLAYAVDRIGAKRVVLDTIEALFSGLSNSAILRAELRRLFGWLKGRGLTTIVTGERGDGEFTRQGLEEYVSDCVVVLDNRVRDQISTRTLRVMKYRGSAHGTNEFPFLIGDDGISVLPITAASLEYPVSREVVPSGIAGLDAMLGRNGFFRGSSVLISGTAGTGKTAVSTIIADTACQRGERCLFLLFEEGADQILRNAHSIGLDLARHVESGLLTFEAARPSLYGLETHLARMHRDLERVAPRLVIVDPISALRGPPGDIRATLLRMIDLLKHRGVTGIFACLRDDREAALTTDQGLASLMDVWIKLLDFEADGERNRTLYVVKARGMSHSHQVREYRIHDHGIDLIAPYIGPGGVVTGTARVLRETAEQAERAARERQTERTGRDLQRRRESLESQILEMRASLEREQAEALAALAVETTREEDRARIGDRRGLAG